MNKLFKRSLSALAVTMFISACMTNQASALENEAKNNSEPMTLYTTDWLRVRTAPSYDANVVTTLAPGSSVTAIDTTSEWVKVRYDGGEYYMHSDYLTMFNGESDSVKAVFSETTDAVYTAADLRYDGIVSWGGYRYTWYSEGVLPGGGLNIDGRHADKDGYICDGDDYICLASDSLAKGTIVNTPFGKQGKVYDCGPGADDILDVYVNW